MSRLRRIPTKVARLVLEAATVKAAVAEVVAAVVKVATVAEARA